MGEADSSLLALLAAFGAATTSWIENDRDISERIRRIKTDHRDLKTRLLELQSSGDWLRLLYGPVRDAITGLASAVPQRPTMTIPRVADLARPDASDETATDQINWPPQAGVYDGAGRTSKPGELALSFFLLSFQEPRIVLRALTQSSAPTREGKRQLFRAFAALSRFITKQAFSAVEWAEFWENLLRSRGTDVSREDVLALFGAQPAGTVLGVPPGSPSGTLPGWHPINVFGNSSSAPNQRFSVNDAEVNTGYVDNSVIMRTGSRTNAAGAYRGGGTGNKAILGVFGYDSRPLSSLASLSVTWQNVVGPSGPFYNPAGAGTVLTPYVNILVDFNPSGPSDLRILVMMDSGEAPAITASIGAYSNPGGLNTLTYSWTSSQNVLIVNAPPNPAPGGIPPAVSVGLPWQSNSYSFAALVAANPSAILKDAYPDDGGMPAGAVMPSILVVSGDSGNVVKSGKRIIALKINGTTVMGK